MSDAAKDILAGACAGMTTVSIMYPMDTIRTRVQMSGSRGKTLSIRKCFSDTFRHEGGRAFYKGMAFPFAAQAIFKVVIFTTNGVAKRTLAKRGLADKPFGLYACGALSGGVNSFIVTPVELVRTRLMLQFGRKTSKNSSSIKGPLDCVRRVVGKHGVLGMWQGLRVTLTRDSLGMGGFFLGFDTMKRALTRFRYQDVLRAGPPDLDILLLSGSTAGFCFWMIALPFDMTKTIIQATKARQGETVPGVVETMTRLFREGGLGRLYTGWPVALGRGVPGAAIMLATHTHVSQAVDEHWARTDQRGRDPVPRAKAIGVVVPPSGKLRTKLTK